MTDAPIDLFRPHMAADVAAHLLPVVTPDGNGRIYCGEGPRVAEFERRFSDLVGAPHPVLAMNSCTSALELALHLAGVSLGSEVISTPVTCTATNGAILSKGGKIVWADVDPQTGLIDPADVQRKITRRTRAIMAVDWAGRSCDYRALRGLSMGDGSGRQLPVIQDAAHHLFVDMHNRGDYVCWSFQAIKYLTCGDGGALLPPQPQHDRARLLRWYGLDRLSKANFRCSQNITEAGWKYHMNDISAAIGLANLRHVRALVKAQTSNAAHYDMVLRDLPGVDLPPYTPEASWWLYTLVVDDPSALIAHLAERGIEASPVHARNDVHRAYYFPSGPLPGVDAFADHEVAIPVGWWLSENDLARVANAVREWALTRMGERKELVSMSA